VAGHYQLSSINLAREVYDKLKNDEFSWADDFKDLHPSPFGQEIYFETIKSLIQATREKSEQSPDIDANRVLPKPLDKFNFEKGNYLPATGAKWDNKWTYDKNWTPKDSLSTREGFVHVPVLGATHPGATLRLSFKGRAIGMAVLSGADAGMVTYSIDNGAPRTIDLYTEWSSMLHLPWYVLLDGNLADKSHILELKIAGSKNANSKGTACRIVTFFKNE
jgi:sialidase-1